MRFPWTIERRGRVADLELRLALCEKKRDQYANAAAKAGHHRDHGFREAARVIQDLRIVKLHLQATRSGERVAYTVELPDAIYFDGFRRDATFRELLGYLLEEMFHLDPIGRDYLIGPRREVP